MIEPSPSERLVGSAQPNVNLDVNLREQFEVVRNFSRPLFVISAGLLAMHQVFGTVCFDCSTLKCIQGLFTERGKGVAYIEHPFGFVIEHKRLLIFVVNPRYILGLDFEGGQNNISLRSIMSKNRRLLFQPPL
jgi:hypothetical protein